MAPPPPKALLFDIGGVCVQSPFQAILDYELANGIPPGYVNYSISRTAPNGSWQKIERGEVPLNDAWFSSFKADLENPGRWREYYARTAQKSESGSTATASPAAIPPVPSIDAKAMFWTMMRTSRVPDPWMYPALQRLRASGRFVLGALSNAVVFPEGIRDEKGVVFDAGLQHPLNAAAARGLGEVAKRGIGEIATPERHIRDVFDVYVSSAHVGMRKPQPEIYQLALERMDGLGKVEGGLGPGDVLFIDDIGENLKAAKKVGMRTLKVELGKAWKAVREMESLLGMELLDPKTVPTEARL